MRPEARGRRKEQNGVMAGLDRPARRIDGRYRLARARRSFADHHDRVAHPPALGERNDGVQQPELVLAQHRLYGDVHRRITSAREDVTGDVVVPGLLGRHPKPTVRHPQVTMKAVQTRPERVRLVNLVSRCDLVDEHLRGAVLGRNH